MPVPWDMNDADERRGGIIIEGDLEEREEEEESYCGAPECNLMCEEGEFCANTGKHCLNYPCCQSVSCIQFSSKNQ